MVLVPLEKVALTWGIFVFNANDMISDLLLDYVSEITLLLTPKNHLIDVIVTREFTFLPLRLDQLNVNT